MKKSLLTIAIISCITILQAQNVGIGTNNPDASSKLDVVASDKGILIPNVDITDLSTAAPISSPKHSLLVYNTNTTTGAGYYYWTGTIWTRITNGDRWNTFTDGKASEDENDRIFHKGQVVLGFEKEGSFNGVVETDLDATANAKLWVGGDIALGDAPNIDPAGISRGILWKGWRQYWNGDKIGAKLLGKYVTASGCSGGRTLDLQFYIDDGTRGCTQEISDPASEQLVMHLDHDGNVGIGTETPDEKLEVDGTIKAEHLIVDAWPAFNVYNNSGGNQSTTGKFNATNEIFDNGNNFNLTTDEFTAPVDGLYQFNWTCYSNASAGRVFLQVNGVSQIQTNSNDKSINVTLKLNAGDNVILTGAGYAMTWYGSFAHNSFSGHLIMGK